MDLLRLQGMVIEGYICRSWLVGGRRVIQQRVGVAQVVNGALTY